MAEGTIKFFNPTKGIGLIKPIHDKVLIDPMPVENKTASGIIIPDTSKEKPVCGKVIAVGPGKKDESMTVMVGDIVLYKKNSGMETSIDGKEYLIMSESDIYLILNR